MLFCRSFLRAAAIAATLSGSKISNATTMPANAGGAPIMAAPASTTSENFFASSTTASSESSNSTTLSNSAVPGAGCVMIGIAVRFADEIIAVPDGLGIEEHAVQHDRHDADETELGCRIERPRRRQRVVRQHQRDGREHRQHRQIEIGAGDLKVLLAVAQAADQNADADQAVADDHHHREHRIARQRRHRLGAEHDGRDQRHLDDGDRRASAAACRRARRSARRSLRHDARPRTPCRTGSPAARPRTPARRPTA